MGQVYPNTAVNPALGHNASLEEQITRFVPVCTESIISASYNVAAGASGADITADATTFLVVPPGYKAFVKAVTLLAHGTATGIDADNTCKIALENVTRSEEVSYVTFSDEVVYPDAGGIYAIPLNGGTNLIEGDVLGISVTQGSTADHNGFMVQVCAHVVKV